MKKFLKITLSILGIAFLCLMILGQVAKTAMKPTIEKEMQKIKFSSAIERANMDCPIPVAMGKGSVDSIHLENDYVTYYISYASDFTNVLSQLKSDEKVKEGMMMCILCMNAQGENQGDLMMDAFVNFGYGLRIVMNGSATGPFDFSENVDDIKALRERYQLNPHEALYNLLSLSIEAEKDNLPMKIDEGMMVTKYKLEEEDIAIIVQVDEHLYSFDQMKANQQLIKTSIMNEGLSQPESHALLDMCKISHTGLIYRMVGKQTNQKLDIKISSDDIRNMVDTPSSVNIQ